MNKNIKRLAGCIFTLLLLLLLLGVLTGLLERKNSYRKYADFFNEKENIDVFLMGSSHMMNAVFPMELYKDYGITAYNFGGHSNQLATTYWVLRNALDYKKPKLVIVDGYLLGENLKRSRTSRFLHLSFDAFPLTTTKLRAVLDLYDDKGQGEEPEDAEEAEDTTELTLTELLWDYTIYHSRWNELGRADFAPEALTEKGAELRTGYMAPGEDIKLDRSQVISENTVGLDYMRKIIELCRQEDIELLLTYMPYPDTGEGQRAANTLYLLAEEYGVGYINFMDRQVVDFDSDMYDERHLNPSGARKVTDYLGSYISENYGLSDHRSDPFYEHWAAAYGRYERTKLKNMEEQDFFGNFLVPLADKNYDFVIYYKDPGLLLQDRFVAQLLNLGIDRESIKEKEGFIYVQQAGERTLYAGGDENIDGISGEIYDSLKKEEMDEGCSMRVLVWKHETGEELLTKDF